MPKFRLTPARRVIAAEAFLLRFHELAPHCVAEGNEALAKLMPGEIPTRGYGKDALEARSERLTARADFIGRVIKQDRLSVELMLEVHGELPSIFAKLWAAYKKAVPAADESRIHVEKDFTWLRWTTGHYKLFTASFTGTSDAAKGFIGNMAIDPALLKAGGPYLATVTDTGLHLKSLNSELQRWKIALRFLRGGDDSTWSRRRSAVGSDRYREIVRRFRAGASLKFCSTTRNTTKVELGAAQLEKSEKQLLTEKRARLLSAADRVLNYRTQLREWAKHLAETAVAKSPVIQGANALREREEATTAFEGIGNSLYNVMQRVCYKADRPVVSLSEPPDCFPSAKSVSDGDARHYSGLQRQFREAYARLVAARAADGTYVSPAPVKETVQDEEFCLTLT